MRISCPTCGAEYDVPVEKLAPGRQVRCAKCSGMWAPVPAVVAPEPPEPPEPPQETEPPPAPPAEPSAPPPEAVVPASEPVPDAPAAPVPSRRARLVLGAGWAVTLLVLIAAGYAAITSRGAVMQAWPPSARVYALLGLAR